MSSTGQPAVGDPVLPAARYVGVRVARVEDARLLTGAGQYVADLTLPGMLHVVFVRSPYARARVLGVDAATASAVPGVRAVLTAADINGDVRAQCHTLTGPDAVEVPRPPLADDEVRFVGDPIALVVADRAATAVDAAELVDIDYEPLAPAVDYAAGSDVDVHGVFPGNLVGGVDGPPADPVEAAIDGAAHVVRATLRQQAQSAAPMEPRAMVAHWQAGELTLHSSTQAPHEYRAFAARLLGVPEHRVRVIARDTGGAFGQKIFVQREEMCLMLAARLVAGPLRWIEERRENLLAAGQSRHEHGDATLAFDADGRLVAARLDVTQDVGAYPTPAPAGSGALIGRLYPGPYRVPLATFTSRAVCSNTVGRSAYRGPWQFETLAREVMLDRSARQLGIDPVELRRRNMLAADELPYTSATGVELDAVTPLETFEHALAMIDYDGFRREQGAARAAGRFLGIGTSTYVEPTTGGFGMYATEGATIRVEPSGVINVYMAGGSAGNSVETTVVQLTADALGADIADVRTIQGDTALTPYGAGTGGSRSGSMTAGAVVETAAPLRDKLVRLAAHRLEARPEDIELAGSRAHVRGTPSLTVSFADLARSAYFEVHELPDDLAAGLEASGRYSTPAPFVWANATHVCTCEVDPLTGSVQLLRYVVAEDCGPCINPNVVDGQIRGGTAQGIAGALFEHLAYDVDGNPLSSTLAEYLVPSAAEIPPIEIGHVESPGPGAGGYKGVGEGGAIGAPAAVVNAVADALAPFEADITELPLSPAAIVAALDRADPARVEPGAVSPRRPRT